MGTATLDIFTACYIGAAAGDTQSSLVTVYCWLVAPGLDSLLPHVALILTCWRDSVWPVWPVLAVPNVKRSWPPCRSMHTGLDAVGWCRFWFARIGANGGGQRLDEGPEASRLQLLWPRLDPSRLSAPRLTVEYGEK